MIELKEYSRRLIDILIFSSITHNISYSRLYV